MVPPRLASHVLVTVLQALLPEARTREQVRGCNPAAVAGVTTAG